ncbi:MAG: ABC transporter permease [Betaproteobacteria bacterium]
MLPQACRSLIRRPGFTVTAVVTLALGIGATTALFSLVDTVILEPLPFPAGSQLVMVLETSTAKSQNASLVAPVRIDDWNRLNRTFDAISGSYAENVTDTSGAEPERLSGRRVLPRFFEVYGMRPLAGRPFAPDEERFGGPTAAVISEGLWTRRYARDPSAVGRRLVLNGAAFTIVGVMPARFTSAAIDVWLPAQLAPAVAAMRDARFVSAVGRMKAGVTLTQARSDLARVQALLGRQYPATDRDWSVSVADLKDVQVGSYRQALWLAFAAVALLLLIAVANIAGLLLVQLHRRAREMAVRAALGASRAQIVGAVMREVLVIAAAGSIGGVLVAKAAVGLLARTFTTLPRLAELALDWRALVFTVSASALAAGIFGLWPSIHATRGDAAAGLAQGGRGSTGAGHRLQRGLVVAQIALSVLLVSSAGLLLRTYYNLSRAELGFDPGRTITFHVGAQWDEDRARIGRMQEDIVSKLQHVPGVLAAGITNFLPATGATLRYQVHIQGVTPAGASGANVGVRTVSAGYLKALRVPLVSGDWCPDLRFDPAAPRMAMVNRRFVDLYGGGANLIGRQIRVDQDPRGPMTITGVVGNVAEDGPGTDAYPYFYGCDSAGTWPDPEYVVRTAGTTGMGSAIRRIVHEVDPARAVFGVEPLDAVMSRALDQPRLDAQLLTLFAAAATLLASVGLYTLLMLVVAERTRELGVRMALGAEPRDVVGLVLARAGRLIAIGVSTGLLATIAFDRLLRGLLFDVGPLDPTTLAGAVLVLALVALAAAAVPAWRASTVDPIEAMRVDA